MPNPLRCPHCGKAKFKSKAGLRQHIDNTPSCYEKDLDLIRGVNTGKTKAKALPLGAVHQAKRGKQSVGYFSQKLGSRTQERVPEGQDFSSGEDDFDVQANQDGSSDDDDVVSTADKSILENFRQFCVQARSKYGYEGGFQRTTKVAIELLSVLRAGKASLGTYESVMAWHLRANLKLARHQTLGSCKEYVGRETIYKGLLKRYNMFEKVNLVNVITLPSSRSQAKIVSNDFKHCLQSLLTDPRITDQDYLFFNDNPLAPLPRVSKDPKKVTIGDINTGQAYRETYKKYIKSGRKQVLLPIIFYIDGAATGQFANLPVTPLKFTLGIFNRKAREKAHMWRTLAYLPSSTIESSRGRRLLLESSHVDSGILLQDMTEDEGAVDTKKVDQAKDLHALLANILQPVVEFIDNDGFIWDLQYKNKTYKGIHFVPFVNFIKADTEEADRLCGSYTSRGKHVKQLCRYCCCPNQETDNPRAEFDRKTTTMIDNLVKTSDANGLKELSQQQIDNAFYKLRFGAHNTCGIHGSCPSEMLHALLLGIFKYVRDCFFAQVGGDDTPLSRDINGLVVLLGDLLSRQSDRNMPKTKFNNGIRKGKLMAKEYRGVLLLLATVLRSTKGKELLKRIKKGTISGEDGIADWIMLVETLLMWEHWLKSDVISLDHVQKARKKHQYIMYLIRKVGNRTEGMGLKIMKYHAISHLCDDIIDFGVPMNVDTGADEAGHKPSKVASKLTQRVKQTFEEQVGKRLVEKECLDLASHEMSTGQPLWHYWEYERPTEDKILGTKARDSSLGGGIFSLNVEKDGNDVLALERQIQGSDNMKLEETFTKAVINLLKQCGDYGIDLPVIRTSYTDSKGIIYRATPLYMGRPWRDWVMVNWEGLGPIPNKLWGFIDLSELPPINDVVWGGQNGVSPAMYAIVESASVDKDKNRRIKSELFTPIVTEIGCQERGIITELKFYLAEVETFVAPAVVIPDVGGKQNGYLMMRSRSEWKTDFERWLDRKPESFPAFTDDSEQENYAEMSDIEFEDEDNSDEDGELELIDSD